MKIWVDFNNGDLCREDGVAIMTSQALAGHVNASPEDLKRLDKILRSHEALISALQATVDKVEYYHEHEGCSDTLREVQEALAMVAEN